MCEIVSFPNTNLDSGVFVDWYSAFVAEMVGLRNKPFVGLVENTVVYGYLFQAGPNQTGSNTKSAHFGFTCCRLRVRVRVRVSVRSLIW